jgi:hydroxymethylpyrimidine pyrophosphatase-like HAD family hydrolase
MIIAVDFDGTIVQHKYPAIGEEIPFAIESLKQLQKEGHQLILWTYRTGDLLQEAVEYCQDKGLEFYAVNQSYPEEDFDVSISRKIYADLYIDDRNIGGIPQWGHIYKMISGKKQVNENFTPKKSSFTRFLEQIFKD